MTLDFEACYRALCAHDERFDGLFYLAVKSTGIYCRPVCRARTPRAASCHFYETAAAAEAAGFRPCLRCRPELAPERGVGAGEPLAHALFTHVQARALGGASMDQVAVGAGYSSRQLRRLLLRSHGVTPVHIAQTQRLLFARRLLRETRLPIIEVALGAGFGSLRRFNALFRARYGMPPSAARSAANGSAHPAEDAEGETLTLRLAYREPFAWQPLLAYLYRRAIPGVESVDPAALSYARTVELAGKTGVVHVTRAEREKCLLVRVPVSLSGVLYAVLERLRRVFDLDVDPVRIATDLSTDGRLAKWIAAVPGLRVPGAWEPFELALRAVLGQQISVAGATTLSGRLAARFGRVIDGLVPNRLSPTAKTLAQAPVEDIAAIGLPGARARAIRALAEAAEGRALDFPPGTSAEAAVKSLREIPGIGEWTAQYIAMRALRFPDGFPAGDLGLQKAAAALAGHPMRAADLLRWSERWRPWRAYAAQYLWHSLSTDNATTSKL